jgi:adenylate kinase
MTIPQSRPMILLLGPPGAGKGTQARFLHHMLAIPHVASGDLLRDHRRRGTPLGLAAQQFMDRGDLVPDEMVVTMVMDRLQRADAVRGALLDGFPRSSAQARTMDTLLADRGSAVQTALYLDVPTEVLVQRIAGRWLCPSCQATYPSKASTTAAPGDGRCVDCKDLLYQRPDDRPEVVQQRLDVYLRETLPVVEHYTARGVLVRIDGGQAIDRVRATLCTSLGGAVRGHHHDRWHVYISNGLCADTADGPWQGRTLCGRRVADRTGHLRGSEADFLAHPCRHCYQELRPRQRPILELPSRRASQQMAGEQASSEQASS